MLTGDATADLEFYVVTAQVVPALFIALAVEMRSYVREHIGEDRRAPLVIALALALAEIESLGAVAAQSADVGDFGVVVGSLTVAGIFLFAVVFGPRSHRPAPASSPEPRPSRWTSLAALAILLIVGRRRRD